MIEFSSTGFPLLGEASRSSGVVPAAQNVNVALPAAIALDECQLDELQARLCSRRGISHAFNGEPRQDDAALVAVDSTLVAVLADGLGSALHSHIGAYYACRASAYFAAHRLSTGESLEDLDGPAFVTSVGDAIDRACKRIVGKAYETEQCLTTLVVALADAASGRVRLFRVGDSEALGLLDGEWIRLFPSAASGLVDNATSCLPGGASHLEECRVDLNSFDCLLLGTDGLAGAINGSPHRVGSYFAEQLKSPLELTEFHRLLGFERRGALDDRTGIAIWKDGR